MTATDPLPACITVEAVARLLGFARHSIPVLVKAGLLPTLGRARHNTVKYFHCDEVIARGRDPQWLEQAVETLRTHWHQKNQRRRVTSHQRRIVRQVTMTSTTQSGVSPHAH